MKSIVHIGRTDYRIMAVGAILIAAVSAVLLENALFHASNVSTELLVAEYKQYFVGFKFTGNGYFRYLLRTEMRKFIVLILLSFSFLGFPLNLLSLYLKPYRYIFLMCFFGRCRNGIESIICITAVFFCLICCIPAYIHLLAVSNRSFDYCTKNHKRFYHCSKYKLQSEVKICIIILIYIVFEMAVETITCGYLFRQIAQI